MKVKHVRVGKTRKRPGGEGTQNAHFEGDNTGRDFWSPENNPEFPGRNGFPAQTATKP
jgi:hypothetical protein